MKEYVRIEAKSCPFEAYESLVIFPDGKYVGSISNDWHDLMELALPNRPELTAVGKLEELIDNYAIIVGPRWSNVGNAREVKTRIDIDEAIEIIHNLKNDKGEPVTLLV